MCSPGVDYPDYRSQHLLHQRGPQQVGPVPATDHVVLAAHLGYHVLGRPQYSADFIKLGQESHQMR